MLAKSPAAGRVAKDTVSAVALIADAGTGLPPTVAAVILLPSAKSGERMRSAIPPGGGLAAKRAEGLRLTW